MSSTTHIQTGPQSTFNYNPQQRLTQMNARPDVMRQPGMPQIPQMAAMSAQPHFIQNRQPEQHGQSPMGMLSNNTNPSPNLLGGVPQGHSPAQAQRMQQMQHAGQQRRQQEILVQAHNAQTMSPSGGGTSGSHLGGLGHNQMASQGFPGNMQPANIPQVRRVQSQPQNMSQSAGQMQMGGGAMHPSQQGGGPMGMGMNGQSAQLRQVPHQQMGLRMHSQMQGSQIPPEMAMGIRQPGNPSMPQNMQRSASAQAQIMASLPHPPALTQSHQVSMQSLPSNNFQNPMSHPHPHSQTMSPSPRLGTRSQPQTPANINLPNPGQPQPNTSRSQPDIFNFQNQQFSQGMPNNAGHIANPTFPFASSSVSPSSQHGEMSQSMGTANTSGSNNRGSFQLTPAQQLQNGESLNMFPPQSNVPPRPPSNNNLHIPLHQQQQPQHHSSPQQQELLTGQQPQRPQSQPQSQPRRPPSQSDLSNTPHTAHSHLPGRIPSLSQQPQPGGTQALHSIPSSVGHPLPIAPRPPPPVSTAAGLSSTTSANFPPPEGGPSQGQPSGIQRPGNLGGYPVGLGQGLTRLLQFSGMLASENKAKLSLIYWEDLIKEYFAPQSILKFTLWKDNQRNEAKPFDIGVPILPRFFLVTTQSGVKSMTLSLDGARERLLSNNHAIVECVTAAWTCKYTNGYTVTLRGPLTAHVVMVQHNTRNQGTLSQPFSLKFENLEFVANFHDKSISLESIMDHSNHELSSPKTPRIRNSHTPTANIGPTQPKVEDDKKWEEPRVIIVEASIPGEPVNAFGIPQATMRCLELAESVGQMADLIAFSDQVGTGPIEGLSLYAARIREVHNPGQGGANTAANAFQNFPTLNGTPAVTLYSSAPPTANAPSDSQPGPSAGPPQNAPSSASNSPQKQHKTIPQPTGPPPPSGQASGSGSTPSGPSMTPSMSNTSLKRKQTDTTSPTTGSEPKRLTRKRRTTDRGG